MAKQIKMIDKLEDLTPDGNNFNRHTECELKRKGNKTMEMNKHAGGRKFRRTIRKLSRMLNKELPTAEICEWHLETFETNSGTRYGMRICFDYDHQILTYTQGDDLSIFVAKVKKEIDFYKNYDKP